MIHYRILAALSLILLMAGYGGALHPAGDSLSVFRVPLVFLTIGLCLLCKRPPFLVWGGSLLALASLLSLIPGWIAPRQAVEADFVLYQKNLWNHAANQTEFLASVLASDADFVTLQEVGPLNRHVLASLDLQFPYKHSCGRTRGRTVVLSAYPMVEGTSFCHKKSTGFAGVQVTTPKGKIWLISVHLAWPWPYRQKRNVDVLEAISRNLKGPKIIGGDFNSMHWASSVARIARASGTARIGHVEPTFNLPYLHMGVTIDHVLTSGTGPQSVQVMPRFSSDHSGLLAQVSVSWP